ncbi:MAG TPA: glycine cleavage system protein R [Woeseiaceae bacterium]|nr:glycine cleavage system protein R [Woeseiaceae bacterium]
MKQLIVLSAIGNNRSGVVNDISRVILDCGGNIEESRMSVLGKEFAMLLLISGNWHTLTRLESELDKLSGEHGFTVTLRKTGERSAKADCMPYGVDVVALDQPGIVFNLASFFANRDIDIEELATRRYAAAHTGAPMFSVQMTVNIPASEHLAQLRDDFMELCDQMNLDAILEPVKS